MIDTELRQMFAQAPAALSKDDTDDVGSILRSGRRRRRMVRAAAVAGGLGVVLAALGVGMLAMPRPALDVTNAPATGPTAKIFLCHTGAGCAAPTDAQISDIEAALQADPEVRTVSYESQEQATARFEERFADQPELLEEASDVPGSFEVSLAPEVDLPGLVTRYRAMAGVAQVTGTDATERNGFIRLPNVVGLPTDQARPVLEEQGLTIESHGAGDTVTDQSPAPETFVEPGSTVVLILDAE